MVGKPDNEPSVSKTINPFVSEAMNSGSPENSSRAAVRFVPAVLIRSDIIWIFSVP
jgi:hypothetical protein